jgi:CheY-like chemotaxis protein
VTTLSQAAALSAALNAPLPPPDPLAAAAAALTASSSSMAAAAAELRGLNSHLRTKLDRVASRRALTREVMVADDSPAALAGLAVALAGVAPLHLVTTDRTSAAGLRALGVTVHVVAGFDEVPGLVRRHRVAVAVVDVHLGEVNGAELVEHLPRGPRVVLVTSHAAARDSLVEVARATQSDALIRTDTGGWADVLRDRVERGLREACG